MTRYQLITLFFLALLLFTVYQVLLILSPFFHAIFWASILAFGFYPLYEKLKRAMKPHTSLAAAVTTLLIFLAFVPVASIILLNLAEEGIKFYKLILAYIQEGRLEQLVDQIRSAPLVQKVESKLLQWDILKQNFKEWILDLAQAVGSFSAKQAGALTKNVLILALQFLLTFFLVFFFLKDGAKIYRFLYEIAPLEEGNKKAIFRQITETFTAVIRGQLFTALTQAVLAGAVFWSLRLPLPVFFATVTFLASLIPVAGASVVWVPFVIYLVALEEYVKAVILFFLGAFVISLVDNILKPAIIGRRTKLPYLLLFLGILGGMKIYGLLGIFLAPTVLSLFFVLTKIYREKFLA